MTELDMKKGRKVQNLESCWDCKQSVSDWNRIDWGGLYNWF